MKKLLIAAAVIAATSHVFAADVAMSVSIGQPGFYGQIDIGDYPQPQLIYQQPVYIERAEVYRQPVYMRVPPGHAKNWRKHCHAYNACGERVYFVQDNWYQREYVPRYQERHAERRDDHRDGRKDDYRDDKHDNKGKHGNNGNNGKNR